MFQSNPKTIPLQVVAHQGHVRLVELLLRVDGIDPNF
jgi:hypothetical protein